MLSKGFSKYSFKHKLLFLFNLSCGPLGQGDSGDHTGNLKIQRWKRIITLLRSRQVVRLAWQDSFPIRPFSAIPRNRDRRAGESELEHELFRDFSLHYCTLDTLNVVKI